MLRAGQLYIQERYGIGFSAEAITTGFLANKKPHSCWLLLILWVLQIAYSYVVNVRNGGDKRFATLTKTMQILTDLNTKLLKTVTVNVLESKYNRKVSDEMANVVKDSGEGRCFLQLGDAMGAAKNVVLEPLASALGVAAVLHK